MTEHAGISFWGEIGREFVAIARRLIAARSEHRKVVFEKAVAPHISTMEMSHRDFLQIFSEVREMLEAAALALQRNDRESEIKKLLEQTERLREVRDTKRVDRRAMYEEVVWRQKELSENRFIVGEIVLSGEETQILHDFYDNILRYFRRSSQEYNHGVHHVIFSVRRLLVKAARGELISDEIKNLSEEINELENQKEELWALVSSANSQLRNALT